MRQLAICLFTLLISLPAVGRCQDAQQHCPYLEQCRQNGKACCQAGEKCCQEGKCCADSTACELGAAAFQARAAARQAAVAAALTEAPACQANVATCQAKATACKAKAAACQAAGCESAAAACLAKSAACQAKAAACQTKAACQVAAQARQAKTVACKKAHVVCVGCASDDTITHLIKAAKHLQAAGMKSEAKRVLAKAEALHRNLLAHKIAELKQLQAEVHRLQHATVRAQKVRIHVQALPASLHKPGLKHGCEVQAIETVVFGEPLQHIEKAFGKGRKIHTLIIVTPEPAGESESPEVVDTPQPVDAPTAQAPATTRKQ